MVRAHDATCKGYSFSSLDINGAWATETGPNAPFQREEGKGATYSFVDSKLLQ